MSHISSNRKPEARCGFKAGGEPPSRRALPALADRLLLPCSLCFARSARQLFSVVARKRLSAPLAPRAGPHSGPAPRVRSPPLRRHSPPPAWFAAPSPRKGQARASRGGFAAPALRSAALAVRSGPLRGGPLRGLPSLRRPPGGARSVATLRRSGGRVPRPPAGLRLHMGQRPKTDFIAAVFIQNTHHILYN